MRAETSVFMGKNTKEFSCIYLTQEGIDYRLPEFRKRDGSTRIRYLWDQSVTPEEGAIRSGGAAENGAAGSGSAAGNGAAISGSAEGSGAAGNGTAETDSANGTEAESDRFVRRPPAGFRLGVEFDSAQINRALEASTQQEQFRLLPSVDTSGHGTAVAGIAVGSSASYQGTAPEAELLVVKLGLPDASSFPRTTEIMRAVTYTVKKAIEMQMPVVINLSFGNTYGAHDGSSLLERFLDNA